MLFADVWRDAARLDRERHVIEEQRDVIAAVEEEHRLHAEEVAADLVEAEDRIDELRSELADLRARAAALSVEQMLEGMTSLKGLVSMIRDHRRRTSVIRPFPVVRMSLDSDTGVVTVRAVSDGQGTVKTGDVVAVRTADHEVVTVCEVDTTTARDITTTLDLDVLPENLQAELEKQPSVSPERFVLILAGVGIDVLNDATTRDLERLEDELESADRRSLSGDGWAFNH